MEISLVYRCFPFNVVAEEDTYTYGPQGAYRDTHPSALRVMEPCRPSYVFAPFGQLGRFELLFSGKTKRKMKTTCRWRLNNWFEEGTGLIYGFKG